MAFQKLINLKLKQKNELDSIQKQIKENGGDVSIMELIDDAIQIFIDKYGDEAVKRYSPSYYHRSG
jgi:hypothetical protein